MGADVAWDDLPCALCNERSTRETARQLIHVVSVALHFESDHKEAYEAMMVFARELLELADVQEKKGGADVSDASS